MRVLRIACILAMVMILAGGCGAIFKGSSQIVDIQSVPSGAKVTGQPGIGGYTTPTTVALARKHSYTLTFTKPGYKSATAHIRASASVGIIILDVLFTGLVGVVVDAATGSWNNLKPENVIATLEKEDMGVIGPDRIEVRLSVTESGVQIESEGEPVLVDIRQTD